MIQLEQQQHGEFWVGGVGRVGRVGNIPTTYIQLAGAGFFSYISFYFNFNYQLTATVTRKNCQAYFSLYPQTLLPAVHLIFSWVRWLPPSLPSFGTLLLVFWFSYFPKSNANLLQGAQLKIEGTLDQILTQVEVLSLVSDLSHRTGHILTAPLLLLGFPCTGRTGGHSSHLHQIHTSREESC